MRRHFASPKKLSPIVINEMTAARRKNYFNLFLGIAFLGYGGYRIYTFITGAEYTTFRIIIALGFIILGGFDLYKFFRKDAEE